MGVENESRFKGAESNGIIESNVEKSRLRQITHWEGEQKKQMNCVKSNDREERGMEREGEKNKIYVSRR